MTEENKENQNELAAGAGVREQEADLAEQFLSRALKHSFVILKIIMAVLVVLFITSGIFRVEENENALVLQFGKIREFKSGTVLGPGLKWAWPEPISEIVKIPVTDVQTVPIDLFWYFQTEQEKLTNTKGYAGPTLDPTRDGYCLTRNDSVTGESGSDYNIVHAKFQLTYRIGDIEKFFRNVYYKTPRPGEDFLDVVSESVDPLLRTVVADAVVATMVNYSLDEAIGSDSRIQNEIRRRIEDKLSQLDSGIAINSFLIPVITWPRQVDAVFQAANQASQDSQKKIIDARSYAGRIISEAGGSRAEDVLVELKKIVAQMQDENIADESKVAELELQRDFYLNQLAGSSREKIGEARAYKTNVIETARANADYLTALLPEYRKRPELVLRNIYQDAVEEVLDNAEEKILIQPGSSDQPRQIRVLVNRDPQIQDEKAKKKAQEQNN